MFFRVDVGIEDAAAIGADKGGRLMRLAASTVPQASAR
jgi:hypothetical protein